MTRHFLRGAISVYATRLAFVTTPRRPFTSKKSAVVSGIIVQDWPKSRLLYISTAARSFVQRVFTSTKSHSIFSVRSKPFSVHLSRRQYFITSSTTKMPAAELNKPPPLPPGKDKHHIVVLEGMHAEMPPFDFPHTIDVHQRTTPSQVPARIKNATVVISCVVPVTPEDMDNAPHLGVLAVMAVGIQWVDKQDCARRGVTVTKCTAGNVDAVTEHFLGLYFATRRRTVQVHNIVTKTSDWVEKGSLAKLWPGGPPMGARQETLGIMGYGALGTRLEKLAQAVGFREVLVSERKNATRVRPGRVSFEEALQKATVLGICLPQEQDTINLIGEKELGMMRKEALIINVARGGIVNEHALAKALKERWIAGAATDVLEREPGGPGTSPLIPDAANGEEQVPNLTICKYSIPLNVLTMHSTRPSRSFSPRHPRLHAPDQANMAVSLASHLAWFTQSTIKNYRRLLKEGVEGWVNGTLQSSEDKVNKVVVVHNGRVWS